MLVVRAESVDSGGFTCATGIFTKGAVYNKNGYICYIARLTSSLMRIFLQVIVLAREVIEGL